jgi:glycogen operon protein
MINAYHEPLTFEIQEGAAGDWKRAIDTSLASPDDIADSGEEVALTSTEYRVHARSVAVLIGEAGTTALV